MSKKKIIFTAILLALLPSVTFFSTGDSTQIVQGNYTTTQPLNNSGTYNVSYSDPLIPNDFSFTLQNSEGFSFTLDKSKLQEVIDLLDSGEVGTIPSDYSGSFYNRTEQLQKLNEVMEIFDDPATFNNLIQSVQGQVTSNQIIDFGEDSVTITSEIEQ